MTLVLAEPAVRPHIGFDVAREGRSRLEAKPLPGAALRSRMEAAADVPGLVLRTEGDLDAARAASTLVLKRRFWAPFHDDLCHGRCRSPSLVELEAGLDARDRLRFWRHYQVKSGGRPGPDGMGEVDSRGVPELASSSVELFPYAVPAVRFEGSHVETAFEQGWMRGAVDAFQAFVANCFLDEVAAVAMRDPIEFRLELLGPPRRLPSFRSARSNETWHDTGRMARVIRRACELSRWAGSMRAQAGARVGRGFATHTLGATYVAIVADVCVGADDEFDVERIACVVDRGQLADANAARVQVEGAIESAVSNCLFGAVAPGAGARRGGGPGEV
jgi:isoquinoline 1-oxidoreductase beta subunit